MKQPVLLRRLPATEEATSQKSGSTSATQPHGETGVGEKIPTVSRRTDQVGEQNRLSQNDASNSRARKQHRSLRERRREMPAEQAGQKARPALTVADVVGRLRLLRHESALLRYLLDRAQREFLQCDLGEPACKVRVGAAVEPAQPDAVTNIVELLDEAASTRDVEAQELLESIVREAPRAAPRNTNSASERWRPVETGVVRSTSSAKDMRKKRGS